MASVDLSDLIKEKTLKRFGSAFQVTALSLYAQDYSFARKLVHTIKPSYFDTKYLRWICDTVTEHIRRYNELPSFDTLKTKAETEFEKKLSSPYTNILEDMFETELTNRKFVEEELERFCFAKHAMEKSREIEMHIESGDFEDAKRLSGEMFKPLGGAERIYDLKIDYREALNEHEHKPIPTPLPGMNYVSKGGPGRGNLAVMVGPSNFGKTAWLTAVARSGAMAGFRVAYFSFEIQPEHIIRRLLAGLIESPQEQLADHEGRIEMKVEGLKGNIKFVSVKATEAYLSHVKGLVEEMKSTGFFPDMIILDGLNQLKLPRGMRHLAGSNNDKFEYLCEEIRDYAGDTNTVIHTVFQTNRTGFNKEINDEQSIGKAIEVFQVADWLIMFSQTIPMEEAGEAHGTLLKNRLGPKGLTLKVSYDPNQGVFTELESVQRSLLYDKEQKKAVNNGLQGMKEKLKEIQSRPLEKKELA